MTESINPIKLSGESSARIYPTSGIVDLISSGLAALILAFLIPFGLLQSCSPANIAAFMVLLGLSAILAFVGVIVGAISYRQVKNRLALFSLLFTVIYIALLIYLLQLIYS